MFQFDHLDEELRGLMLEEFERDAAEGDIYFSKRFTDQGKVDYPDLMREAIRSGNETTLRDSLNSGSCMAEEELRAGKSVKVPVTAAETFAEGEFNRFYARATCLRALNQGRNEVVVYRAKPVSKPRQESENLVGQRLPATTLLDDLRTNIGDNPALRLPGGPNSGLSVRCA